MTSTTTNTITGKVLRVIRHGHTVNGNPTMSAHLDSPEHSSAIPVRVQDDSGLIYEIENPCYRDESHVFKLSKAGRIYGVSR